VSDAIASLVAPEGDSTVRDTRCPSRLLEATGQTPMSTLNVPNNSIREMLLQESYFRSDGPFQLRLHGS
jgi:hypothetical protein